MRCPICNKPYNSFEQYEPHECLSYEEIKKKIRREALEDAIADISESCGPSVWDALEKLRALAEAEGGHSG